jgi:hypothetical protein
MSNAIPEFHQGGCSGISRWSKFTKVQCNSKYEVCHLDLVVRRVYACAVLTVFVLISYFAISGRIIMPFFDIAPSNAEVVLF